MVSPYDVQPNLITFMPTHVLYFFVKDVSDEGTEEENELAPTGDNTTDEQEETNVVSCHHDEQKQVIFRFPYLHTKNTTKHHCFITLCCIVHCVIQQINKETSGVQSESKENSNIAIEEDNPDKSSPEFATEPTMTT